MTESDARTAVETPGTPPSPTAQQLTVPPAAPHSPPSSAVPWGTLMVVGVLLLSILWLWTLVLGIQQGRA
jgi:hypothetical protein